MGTPFAGGQFRVKLVLGKDFPTAPPKGFFLTRIFHPNVAASGEICVNSLKKDWNPNLGIKYILMVSFMVEPTRVGSRTAIYNLLLVSSKRQNNLLYEFYAPLIICLTLFTLLKRLLFQNSMPF